MPDKIARLLSTFFYVGDIPVAPGTAASFAGLLLAAGLSGNTALYVLFTLVITISGFAASGKTEKEIGQKDPSCIVIDEVAGIMIALFLLPLTPAVLITAFFLFRAFDMFKIYPVNRFEGIPGGAGIMFDDLFAGLYTNIAMHIAIFWAGII